MGFNSWEAGWGGGGGVGWVGGGVLFSRSFYTPSEPPGALRVYRLLGSGFRVNPKPQTLNPNLQTPNPKPKSLDPTPQTLNPKPSPSHERPSLKNPTILLTA